MHATLQERTGADQAAARLATRPGRRRALAALAAPLLVLGAGATYVGTHEPFADSGGAFNAGLEAGGFQALRADSRQTTSDGDPEVAVVDPPVGSRFGVVLTVLNDGRFPVEVVDVKLPVPGDYYFGDLLAYASSAPGGSGLPFVPLEPFTLPSGEARDVGVSYRLTGCKDGPQGRGAGTVTFPAVLVTWRFAGLTRQSEVPLDGVAGIQGLPQCAATD